ncbi:hypothetical protein QR680_018451 [Steinernema hermaphroditum]|uniref:Plus3 domain-containing protein n=1 Tax=Steinernema hermaphroditum TaxID=289476 RepID=A0AA39HI04_9BILA|nr:hypothetical protein QR680_018451 [Steinernema hermaphroditum]
MSFSRVPLMYRSDMTIDDEDAHRLNSMSQFDRELELERRMQQQDMFQIHRNIYDKRRSLQCGRSQMDAEDDVVIVGDDDAEQQQHPNQDTVQANAKEDVVVVGDVFDDTEDGEISSSSSSSSGYCSQRSRTSSCSSAHSRPSSSDKLTSKEQLEMARVSRNDMADFCHAPFFYGHVLGCFVKQIVDVIEDEKNKPYDLEKTRTNALLRLKSGEEEDNYAMSYVSNSPITEDEFTRWMQIMADKVPFMDEINQKAEYLKQLRTRQMTERDITHILERKAKFRDANIQHLMDEMKRAKKEGDIGALVKCRNELQALDAPKKPDTNAEKPKTAPTVRVPRRVAEISINAEPPVKKSNDEEEAQFIRKSGMTRYEKVKDEDSSDEDADEEWFYSPYYSSQQHVEETMERLLKESGYEPKQT